MAKDRIKIPSYLVDEIQEFRNSNRVEFIMKGGIRLIAKKTDFHDYEKFKSAVERHHNNRKKTKSNK